MTGAKILVVEDEGIVAKGLEVALRSVGHSVVGVAVSADEAVDLASRHAPDLVLMDIHLRGDGDGIEAAGRIRAARDIPVVFLTAFDDEATVTRAQSTGPFGYLVKPFDERLLQISVQMALHKHESERRIRETMAELSKANRRLASSEALLRALFRSLPCGVLAVDRQGNVRTLNPFVERLFNVSHEEAGGRPVSSLFRCHGGEGAPFSCEKSFCSRGCIFREVAEEAFERGTAARRHIQHPAAEGGETPPLSLALSAATGTLGDETLCFILVEDRTEIGILKSALRSEVSFRGLVGGDETMRDLFEAIREVAEEDVPVLIQGESGTGKELVALAIHAESPRAERRFVAVNCGALPEGLLESELFGHERGAFTGASREKRGRFELADGGTIFLDEVGELSPAMQVKLLRVLQSGSFERVGGESTRRVDVRVVSATNRDLRREVAEGRFRQDLFYRLCVVPLFVPPLRNRTDDIPRLVEHFLKKIATGKEGISPAVSPQAMSALRDHAWPGNVRELENALQYAHIKARGAVIGPAHLPPSVVRPPEPPPEAPRLNRLTAEAVNAALRATGGNRVQAAKRLRVSRATLYRFLSAQNPSSAEDA